MALFISLSAGNAQTGLCWGADSGARWATQAGSCLMLLMGSAPGPAPRGSSDLTAPNLGEISPQKGRQPPSWQSHVLAPRSHISEIPDYLPPTQRRNSPGSRPA